MRKLTTEEFLEKLRKRYPNIDEQYDFSKFEYKKSGEKTIVICRKHGEFQITPNNLLNGKGCRQCGFEKTANSKRWTKEKFLAKVKELGKDEEYEYLLDDTEITGAKDKVKIKCKKCGKTFEQTIDNHINNNQGCPVCKVDKIKSKQRMSNDEFVKKVKEIHGDKIKPLEKYVNARTKIRFRCGKCGYEWKTKPDSVVRLKTGCPRCAGNLPQAGKDIKKKFKEVHGDKYDYTLIEDDVVYKAKTKVPIICREHGIFEQTVTGHKGGKGCPVCNESQGEKEIAKLLNKLGIKYIREYRLEDAKYRYDFYLPDFNILIEFHGEQHYKPIEHFGGEKGLKKREKYDEEKRILADSLGMYLIEIPYYDLKFIRSELLKKLKNVYPYWYSDDGKIRAFRSLTEVYEYFDIPTYVKVAQLPNWLQDRKIIKLF